MAKSKSPEIVGKIVEMLGDLNSDERRRVIQASLTLLGEAPLNAGKSGQESADQEAEETPGNLPARVRTWMRQNDLSSEKIQQVFHNADGRVELIASEIPGNGKKEKTLNAYVLAGLANYLRSGESTFDDNAAKGLCESHGCLDKSNHAATLKAKGNEFTGSKEGGWTLTGPGLKRAAELVKMIAK